MCCNWYLILVWSQISRSGGENVSIIHSAGIAFFFAVSVLLPMVVGVHILYTIFVRRMSPLRAAFLVATIFAGVSLFKIVPFSSEFIAGEWISAQSWKGALQVFLLVAGVIAVGFSVIFHIFVVFIEINLFFTKKSGLKWHSFILILFLYVVIAALVWGAENWLQSYSHLLAYLLPVLGWVSGTLFWAIFTHRVPKKITVVMGTIGVIAFAIVSIYGRFTEFNEYGNKKFLRLSAAYFSDFQGNSDIRFSLDGISPRECNSTTGIFPRNSERGTKQSPQGIKNVIFITVDALRGDLLGKRYQNRDLTPNINQFSKRSLRFTNAHASYPATLFAVGGALTGQYSSDILLSPRLPPNVFTLTKSIFDSQHIFHPDNKWFKKPIIQPLFVQSARQHLAQSSEEQTEQMVQMLKRSRADKKSVFAAIHYFDPHSPYENHEGFSYGDTKKEKYFSEVSFVDNEVGRLLRYLDDNNWTRDTLIILFSDHGQALGERGYWGHHVYLNDWTTRIILLLYFPGVRIRAIDTTVSEISVTPTVLDAFNIAIPNDMDTSSLLQAGAHGLEDTPVFSEAFPLRGSRLFEFSNMTSSNTSELLKWKLGMVQSVISGYDPKVSAISGDWRLIVNRVTGESELYNDRMDPQNNLKLTAEKYKLIDDMLLEKLLVWHRKRSIQYFCTTVD